MRRVPPEIGRRGVQLGNKATRLPSNHLRDGLIPDGMGMPSNSTARDGFCPSKAGVDDFSCGARSTATLLMNEDALSGRFAPDLGKFH